MKLGTVAKVRSGLVLARKQARNSSDTRYPLMTLRSINPSGYIDSDQTEVFVAAEPLSLEYLSHPGDVIVRLTAPYTAVLIDEATAGIVISSNFLIIRTDNSQILPEYLFWLLNTPSVKRSIYESSSSNMLGAVKAKYFAEFEITPPPIHQQQKIAAMNKLALRETQLLYRLADAKERYYGLMIAQAHEEMKRGN